MEPTTDITQLTPEDLLLVRAYLDHHQDLFAFADAVNKPPHELLAWLTSDHVRAAIEDISSRRNRGHLAAALATLHELHTTSEKPIERRRAATTVVSALKPRAPRQHVPPPEPEPPQAPPVDYNFPPEPPIPDYDFNPDDSPTEALDKGMEALQNTPYIDVYMQFRNGAKVFQQMFEQPHRSMDGDDFFHWLHDLSEQWIIQGHRRLTNEQIIASEDGSATAQVTLHVWFVEAAVQHFVVTLRKHPDNPRPDCWYIHHINLHPTLPQAQPPDEFYKPNYTPKKKPP
jgi:hypothetical protein